MPFRYQPSPTYQVGDTVYIRKDIQEGQGYAMEGNPGLLHCTKTMATFRGRRMTVRAIETHTDGDFYLLEDEDGNDVAFYWVDGMFEDTPESPIIPEDLSILYDCLTD